MYAGSFAASLKGIACTRGFVILLACVSTSIFLLSLVEVFSLFRLHRTLYVAFPIVRGMPACLPTTGKKRFDSVTQHNQLHGFILQNLHCYSRLSM
nr:MAG TPA: hypothetical protein [Caudoviricetes sp.]